MAGIPVISGLGRAILGVGKGKLMGDPMSQTPFAIAMKGIESYSSSLYHTLAALRTHDAIAVIEPTAEGIDHAGLQEHLLNAINLIQDTQAGFLDSNGNINEKSLQDFIDDELGTRKRVRGAANSADAAKILEGLSRYVAQSQGARAPSELDQVMAKVKRAEESLAEISQSDDFALVAMGGREGNYLGRKLGAGRDLNQETVEKVEDIIHTYTNAVEVVRQKFGQKDRRNSDAEAQLVKIMDTTLGEMNVFIRAIQAFYSNEGFRTSANAIAKDRYRAFDPDVVNYLGVKGLQKNVGLFLQDAKNTAQWELLDLIPGQSPYPAHTKPTKATWQIASDRFANVGLPIQVDFAPLRVKVRPLGFVKELATSTGQFLDQDLMKSPQEKSASRTAGTGTAIWVKNALAMTSIRPEIDEIMQDFKRHMRTHAAMYKAEHLHDLEFTRPKQYKDLDGVDTQFTSMRGMYSIEEYGGLNLNTALHTYLQHLEQSINVEGIARKYTASAWVKNVLHVAMVNGEFHEEAELMDAINQELFDEGLLLDSSGNEVKRKPHILGDIERGGNRAITTTKVFDDEITQTISLRLYHGTVGNRARPQHLQWEESITKGTIYNAQVSKEGGIQEINFDDHNFYNPDKVKQLPQRKEKGIRRVAKAVDAIGGVYLLATGEILAAPTRAAADLVFGTPEAIYNVVPATANLMGQDVEYAHVGLNTEYSRNEQFYRFDQAANTEPDSNQWAKAIVQVEAENLSLLPDIRKGLPGYIYYDAIDAANQSVVTENVDSTGQVISRDTTEQGTLKKVVNFVKGGAYGAVNYFFVGDEGAIHRNSDIPYITADSIAEAPTLLERVKQSVGFGGFEWGSFFDQDNSTVAPPTNIGDGNGTPPNTPQGPLDTGVQMEGLQQQGDKPVRPTNTTTTSDDTGETSKDEFDGGFIDNPVQDLNDPYSQPLEGVGMARINIETTPHPEIDDMMILQPVLEIERSAGIG